MGHFGRKPIPARVVRPGPAGPDAETTWAGRLLLRERRSSTTCSTQRSRLGCLPDGRARHGRDRDRVTGCHFGRVFGANTAVQLGYAPRLDIRQTSSSAMGQIYIPSVNWVFMGGTLLLVFVFKESSALAAAYGVAVSTTMLATTLSSISSRGHVWGWSRLLAAAVAIPFLCIDLTFSRRTSRRFQRADGCPSSSPWSVLADGDLEAGQGGAVTRRSADEHLETGLFLQSLALDQPTRVPGTAIFLTGQREACRVRCCTT